MSRESLVTYLDLRGDQPGRADADDEVFVVAELEAARSGRQILGRQPYGHEGVSVSHGRHGRDDLDGGRVLTGDGAQVGDGPLLPGTEPGW